jgi:hypothetical protein
MIHARNRFIHAGSTRLRGAEAVHDCTVYARSSRGSSRIPLGIMHIPVEDLAAFLPRLRMIHARYAVHPPRDHSHTHGGSRVILSAFADAPRGVWDASTRGFGEYLPWMRRNDCSVCGCSLPGSHMILAGILRIPRWDPAESSRRHRKIHPRKGRDPHSSPRVRRIDCDASLRRPSVLLAGILDDPPRIMRIHR